MTSAPASTRLSLPALIAFSTPGLPIGALAVALAVYLPRYYAGHFGLGHGNGAHAPNEYYVIESANPKIQGIAGAIRAQVDYLYELAV